MPTWVASNIRGRIYAADVYEDYLSLLRDRSWAKKFFGLPGALGSLIAKSGTYFTSRASLTTVADVQVPPFNARHRLVLRNLPDSTHLTQSGALAAKPRAIYIGDVRESRGLHIMLQAAELATEWEFDIVGPLSDHDAAWVHLWSISHEDASSRVTFHGRLSPEKSWALVRGAWVGLSLLQPTPAFVAAIPSKLYEYMSVGLATISTSLPRSAELIEKSGSGKLADTPSEVAALLQCWEKNPAEIEVIRKQALTWANENLDAGAEYGAMVEAVRQSLTR